MNSTRPTPSGEVKTGEIERRLGFRFEDRGGIDCIVGDEGGVTPATMNELALWSELRAMLHTPAPAEVKVGGSSSEAMVETYLWMHEAAKELGYESVLEALEHLEELRTAPTEGKKGSDLADDFCDRVPENGLVSIPAELYDRAGVFLRSLTDKDTV